MISATGSVGWPILYVRRHPLIPEIGDMSKVDLDQGCEIEVGILEGEELVDGFNGGHVRTN